jgi:hypothetical protein
MEYREAGRQPAAAAAVEMSAGSEGEGWYDDVATTAAADQGRSREPPPPLTHDDNRGFLRMLREKKERSDLSVVCGLSLLSYKSRKRIYIYPCIMHRSSSIYCTHDDEVVLAAACELIERHAVCMVIRLGVEAARVEVRFERLTVEADVRVGRRAVPTLLNCAVNAAQVTDQRRRAARCLDPIPSSSIAASFRSHGQACCCDVFASLLGFLSGFVSSPSSSACVAICNCKAVSFHCFPF